MSEKMASEFPLIARIDIASSGKSIRRLTESSESPQGTAACTHLFHPVNFVLSHVASLMLR